MAKIIKKEEANILWTDDPDELKPKKKAPEASLDPKDLVLNIRPEKKGRGGKTVTVIYNFPLGHSDFKKMVKKLKRLCGTGGTFKQDSIEIQGDHREKIKAYLESQGYQVKFTGG